MERNQNEKAEEELSLSDEYHTREGDDNGKIKSKSFLSPQLLHEVFLNPGLGLLFGGIGIGYISGLQGPETTRADDGFFVAAAMGLLARYPQRGDSHRLRGQVAPSSLPARLPVRTDRHRLGIGEEIGQPLPECRYDLDASFPNPEAAAEAKAGGGVGLSPDPDDEDSRLPLPLPLVRGLRRSGGSIVREAGA